jgi:hypothetical protein
MANLKEQAKWEEGIYQYEITDPLQGGEDGLDNVQGRQLANRTLYLKEGLETHSSAENPHKITAEKLGVYTAQQIDERVALLNKTIEDNGVYTSALVDESKCRNLLDVLGIRAAHSDEPATLEEVKKAMDILHKKINADGSPDFSGLRLGDYLDLPELNDGETTYKWNSEYKNLRIMISAFNFYKGTGRSERDNEKNHIVFTFRHIVSYYTLDSTSYEKSKAALYLDNGFRKGLEAVIGNIIYPIARIVTTYSTSSVFLMTDCELWGYPVVGERYEEVRQTIGQYPIFQTNKLYKIKRLNGSPIYSQLAVRTSYGVIICNGNGLAHCWSYGKRAGIAPAFCIS